MINVGSMDSFHIKGRGLVHVIKCPTFGCEGLMGSEISIDGKVFRVRGLEVRGYLESTPIGEPIGVLVSEESDDE